MGVLGIDFEATFKGRVRKEARKVLKELILILRIQWDYFCLFNLSLEHWSLKIRPKRALAIKLKIVGLFLTLVLRQLTLK